MAAPPPLSATAFDAFFSDEPDQYPGYLGHTTLALSPPDEQPPTVLERGPVEADAVRVVTPAEADHFVREGWVIIEGLISAEQLELWRRQFWDVIGADPHDSSGWPGATFAGSVWEQNKKGPCVNALNPPVGHHPRVRGVVAQLGGPGMAEGQRPKMPERPQEPIEHAVVHFAPAEDLLARGGQQAQELPASPPTGGHVDGANPPKGGWVGGCAIVSSTYLFDVAATGGGTCFFPGSHTAVGRFFEEEPEQFQTGEFARGFGYGGEHDQDLFQYGGSGEHLVATMKAGSVCFTHGYLTHTTTPNLNPDTIRLGT